jgi:8-oxo-dGTP diphosphatase
MKLGEESNGHYQTSNLMEPNVIEVVGAVIVRQDLVLATRRGPGGEIAGLWEFPGGKLEPGESPIVALKREIREELLCDIVVGQKITTTRREHKTGIISLTTYYCTLAAGEPQLTEHAEKTWIAPEQLHTLDWAPADLPAVRQIQKDFSA